ncbi:MAG: hypothetical protein WCN85_07265 [Burkholderiales bacterium]
MRPWHAGSAVVSLLLMAFASGAIAPAVNAHELQANRATLVLRDERHLSLSLFIDYVEALHASLAPDRPMQAFLAQFSAMKPAELQTHLLRTQQQWIRQIELSVVDPGRTPAGRPMLPLALRNWIWPDAPRVQRLLQERLMQELVAPAGHGHDEPMEIRAESTALRAVSEARLSLPKAFGRVLIVWYRPRQFWVDPGTVSGVIRFTHD